MSAAAVSAATGIYIFNSSRLGGLRYFAHSFFAMCIWSLANSIELLAGHLALKVFLTKLSYLGIISATPLLFSFAAHYTGRTKYLTTRWQLLIWFVPFLILISAFSNEYHYFQWKSYTLTDSIAGKVVYYESGPGVFIIAVYSYLLLTVSYILLISYFIKTHKFYKKQLFLLLLSLMIPWVLNISYITRTNPFPELDFAPIGLILSNIIVLTAIWRFRLLKLLPQAKDILFNSIPDPILVVDAQYTVTDYNPALRRLIIGGEPVDKKISEILPGLEFTDGTKPGHNTEYQFSRGVQEAWYDVSLSRISSKSGELEGFLIVLRNITKRKMNEEKVRESEGKLRELNASKDKFFSIIAHDLKNPFSNILNLSNLLLEDRESMTKEEFDNFIIMLSRISHTSFELLENLLQWSRSQTGAIYFSPENVRLRDLISRGVNEVKYNAENKGVQIIVPDIPGFSVVCDPNMIAVVLRNLLMNAIKFSYSGTHIEIGFEERAGTVSVSVKDSGTGMSEQVSSGLFKLAGNVTRTGTANEQGTGLGLILCKEFVEKNNGAIRVESELSKGSAFYITLPKAPQ